MKTDNIHTLRPVHPNAGISAEYQKRLKRLISEMQSSIVYWLTARYKATGLAQDDAKTPANEMQDAMDELAAQWQRNFDTGAEKLGKWFAQKTKSYADGSLQNILKESGFTVDFKMTAPMQDAYDAVIHENVGLIKSIASQHLQEVQGLVMRSVQQGAKLSELTKELMTRYGITKRRAVLIARDQNNKATAVITRVRQKEIGVTQAKWKHSHAGKHPRPSHVDADGDLYDIDKGMYLDGKWVWPGTEINCRCTSQAVISGFEY